MKIKIISLALVISILMVGCNTIPQSTNNPNESTISVNGTGNASASPDLVDIQLGVDTVNTDPNEAVSQNSADMNELMTVLEDMGIAATDIQTSNYNMWVEDIYGPDNQPSGEKRYHIGEATKAGASIVAGITFGLEDKTELEQAALDDAIDKAQEKAEWMASEMNLNLGSIVNVIEGGSFTPPMPYFAGIGGGDGESAVPISQGQVNMTSQVQVIFELLP
jgi:uncharacterized protein YggE